LYFGVFAAGLIVNVVALLFYQLLAHFQVDSPLDYDPTTRVANAILLFLLVLGPFCTLIAGAAWASRARWGPVLSAVGVVGLLFGLFAASAHIGFDDPLVLVFPFCVLVGLTFVVARSISYFCTAIAHEIQKR
jgi:hypothetical protein